jgi:predicted metalloprotease
MNRNQKIAIGCGVAGCLGLILIVILVVVLGVLGYVAIPGMSNSNRNYNFNANGNSNSNSNTNTDSNSNSNTNSDSDSSSSSSMTEDDKHKLFQAAGVTKDSDLIVRVLRKIGFPNGTGDEYSQFIKAHFGWAMKNLEFIQSVNTPEKARAFVDQHFDD